MQIRYLFIIALLCGLASFARAQLQINEVVAYNLNGSVNPLTGEPGDWIEIHNRSGQAVLLDGYTLSDDPRDPGKWTFPEGTEVGAGGFLVVWADNSTGDASGLQTGFGLDVAGESVILQSPSGEPLDLLTYPRMYPDVSYGENGDGSGTYFEHPTPGHPNDMGSAYRISGPVVFDPPAGIFAGPLEVNLHTAAPEAVIRYTLDGSVPGQDDPVYGAPIPIGESTSLRARAWENGARAGEPVTASYILHEPFDLPVVALAAEPDHLWDDRNGIYVEGTNGITGYCSDDPRNWNQDWERPVSMEYFDQNGERGIRMDMGMKIHGGCSRQSPLKSLGLIARNIYGDNSMEYRFFGDKEADEFKGLILRNAGNDFWYSYIRDAVIQQTVCRRMDLDYQAYDPVHVYLNGQYWGIHNLREKVNEHWVSSNYGIPEENLDFLKNFHEVFEGTSESFDELMAFIEDRTLAIGSYYDHVARQIDIPSYTDYLTTQLFFANRDWPGNNQKYWRDRIHETRWRWILFDMEFSMGLYDFDPAIDMFEFATADDVYEWPNPVWATLLIRRLLENEDFRSSFLSRYMIHLNTTFSPASVIRVIDSLQAGLQPSFTHHLERWGYLSMHGWEERVEELREFARQRPGHVWSNMRNHFSLGPPVELKVGSTGGKGTVLLNGVGVPHEGFTGKYLEGFPLKAEFHPVPGYRIDQWEVTTYRGADTLLIPRSSRWRYFDAGTYPGDGWTGPGYGDSHWGEGPAELGYGDGDEATVTESGSDPDNKPITTYFRATFQLGDTARFESYRILLRVDDGAVIYVNGSEAVRYNMPAGTVEPGTPAVTYMGGEDEIRFRELLPPPELFREGENTVAVEVHQVSHTSSDISFDLELSARGTPETETRFMESPLSEMIPGGSLELNPVILPVERNIDLVINEFMAIDYGGSGEMKSDWIEVYNAGDSAVDMAGLYLTDDFTEPLKWQIPRGFPSKTTVPASGFLLFEADGNTLLGPTHLPFRLEADGEFIGLCYPSADRLVWLDSVRYGQQAPGISEGRFPDGTGEWIPLSGATPGYPNAVTGTRPPLTAENHFRLYPNPAGSRLFLHREGPGPLRSTITITDLSGRRLLGERIFFTEGASVRAIDLSPLGEGLYILRVETTTGITALRFIRRSP